MGASLKNAGVNLTGIDELQQSLSLYFITLKGSIPLHPELGFGIFDYVDRNVSLILALIREVNTGVALWDNRIKLISAVPIFGVGTLTMKVAWAPANNTTNIINQTFPTN